MDYILVISATSFLLAGFILLRRVHENRIAGVQGDHKSDTYWPLNIIWNYLYSRIRIVAIAINKIISPHIAKLIAFLASKMFRFTSYISQELLHISNIVHGKGSLKKNTGNTSLFIRDISEYKKNILRK